MDSINPNKTVTTKEIQLDFNGELEALGCAIGCGVGLFSFTNCFLSLATATIGGCFAHNMDKWLEARQIKTTAIKTTVVNQPTATEDNHITEIKRKR